MRILTTRHQVGQVVMFCGDYDAEHARTQLCSQHMIASHNNYYYLFSMYSMILRLQQDKLRCRCTLLSMLAA